MAWSRRAKFSRRLNLLALPRGSYSTFLFDCGVEDRRDGTGPPGYVKNMKQIRKFSQRALQVPDRLPTPPLSADIVVRWSVQPSRMLPFILHYSIALSDGDHRLT